MECKISAMKKDEGMTDNIFGLVFLVAVCNDFHDLCAMKQSKTPPLVLCLERILQLVYFQEDIISLLTCKDIHEQKPSLSEESKDDSHHQDRNLNSIKSCLTEVPTDCDRTEPPKVGKKKLKPIVQSEPNSESS